VGNDDRAGADGSPHWGSRVDLRLAADWARSSLGRGSSLARRATRRLPTLTAAVVFAVGIDERETFDDSGRGLTTSAADRAARDFLSTVKQMGNMTLVVEDDTGRRGDPKVGRVAFVDDRLLRWEGTGDGGLRAADLLRTGAFGYPLNAFLCRAPASDLGLSADHELTAAEQEVLVDAVCAIIVSVWDAETYLALLSQDMGFDPSAG